MLANAGHFDVEIALRRARRAGRRDRREVLPLVEQYDIGRRARAEPAGRRAAWSTSRPAEGHPAAVMDMSFANQALAVEYLVARRARRSSRACTRSRTEIDREVARLKLASLGVGIDVLTRRAARLPDELEPGR